jgi:LacI family transcriptional regulator
VADRLTIYEVAERSGVSTATVSRVMADGKGFSAATRDRVMAAAAELGWVPSWPARSLASRHAGVVGLLFASLGHSGDAAEESPRYVDLVIRGAERAATSAGDAVLIAATHCASGRELAFSVAGKADGLVVMARSLPEQDIAVLARCGPVVVLATHDTGGEPDFAGTDNRGGCRAITAHLIRVHARTDLAFLAGPADSPDSGERFARFCEALRQADLPVPDSPAASGGFTEAGGRQAVAALLAGGRRPQAIVCGNDEMAIGALIALRAKRVRVPADVAVTGFDGIAVARHVRPALTTVRQPMRELGERAVRLLLARIADPVAPRHSVVLPTEVVIRRSCGCRSRSASTALPTGKPPAHRQPTEEGMSGRVIPERGMGRFTSTYPFRAPPGIACHPGATQTRNARHR